MKFEIVDNGMGSLDYRGYVFAKSSDRIIDDALFEKLKYDRGEMFVENEKDEFYEGCFNPICSGDDGRLYAVQFVQVDSASMPFIWQEVEPMTVDNCTIEQARAFAHLTQAQVSERLRIPIRTLSNWETGSRKPNDWTERLVKKELLRIAHENKEEE